MAHARGARSTVAALPCVSTVSPDGIPYGLPSMPLTCCGDDADVRSALGAQTAGQEIRTWSQPAGSSLVVRERSRRPGAGPSDLSGGTDRVGWPDYGVDDAITPGSMAS